MKASLLLLLPVLASASASPFPLDTDGDGLPDDWEDAMSLDKTDSDDADSDTDGDPLSPHLEYALGGTIGTNDADRLPKLEIVADGDNRYLELEFKRRRDNACFAVVPEFATDLAGSSFGDTGFEMLASPVRTAR